MSFVKLFSNTAFTLSCLIVTGSALAVELELNEGVAVIGEARDDSSIIVPSPFLPLPPLPPLPPLSLLLPVLPSLPTPPTHVPLACPSICTSVGIL